MQFKYLIYLLLICSCLFYCKRKPKKSIDQLATQVKLFDKTDYIKSHISDSSKILIHDFGSLIDTTTYASELDTIAQIVARESKHEDVLYTPDGILYIIQEYGGGNYPQDGDLLQVQVETYTSSGQLIFSTNQLKQSLQFILGKGQVVPCWDQVFKNVQEGSVFTIIAPSAFSYGKRGVKKSVPPNTILRYEVKFEKIVTPNHPKDKITPSMKVNEEKKETPKSPIHLPDFIKIK